MNAESFLVIALPGGIFSKQAMEKLENRVIHLFMKIEIQPEEVEVPAQILL